MAVGFRGKRGGVRKSVNLREPEAVSLSELVERGQERQLAQLTAAATRDGASRSVVLPVPSWLKLFQPQHCTFPPGATIAHV